MTRQSITIERDIPDGWKLIAIRWVHVGEYFYSEAQQQVILADESFKYSTQVRSIVERISNEGGE